MERLTSTRKRADLMISEELLETESEERKKRVDQAELEHVEPTKRGNEEVTQKVEKSKGDL